MPGTLHDAVALVWRSLGPYHVARARAAAERFAARNSRTIVIELCDSEESRDWRIGRGGLPFDLVTLAQGRRLTGRSRSLAGELWRRLDELRPKAVAVAGYDRPEMRTALRWANARGSVAVLMSETKWDDRPRPGWRRWLSARQVRRANAALVSGGPAGEYLVALGMPRERIFRHYGAVDNEFFASRAEAVREGNGRAAHPPYFIACCRLIEQRKNIRTLLDAYARYRSRAGHAAWGLVICGDGPDRATLEATAASLCGGSVEFAGFQQADELVESYARAGCFVHVAVNEAWGLVVNEAMASGLPVLVSRRCGCAHDLVHEGVNGFTFDPHDSAGLARLMWEMAERRPSERRVMGQASQRIVARYGCEAFATGLEDAIRSVDHRDLPVGRGRGRIAGSSVAVPDVVTSQPVVAANDT